MYAQRAMREEKKSIAWSLRSLLYIFDSGCVRVDGNGMQKNDKREERPVTMLRNQNRVVVENYDEVACANAIATVCGRSDQLS